MANTEDRKLAVDVIARVDKLEKAMGKAKRVSSDTFKSIETRNASMVKNMTGKMAGLATSFGVGLAGGIAAALGPLLLFQKAIHALGDLNDLKRLSDRVGLTTTTVQALQYGAVQAGVALDQMGDGIGDFAAKVAEASTGAGQLGPIFKANGIELKNQDGTLRSTRDVLGDFADLIKNAGSAQAQLFLAQQAFGDEAAKLVPIFKNGADGLTKLELTAKEAGAVVDEALVKRAAELDTRFDTMWQTFTVRSKSALLTAIEGMDNLLAKQREFEKGRNAVALGKLAGSLVPPKGGTITAPTQDRVTGLDARMAGEPVQADAKLVELLRASVANRSKTTIIPASNSGGGGGGSSSAKESIDFAERMIDSLERQKSLIGASELEIQKSNALWRAGKDATQDQKDEITALVTSIYTATQAHEAQQKAIEDARDAARDFAGTLVDGLLSGEKATKVLERAVSQLASRLLNSGLDQLFGVGGSGGGGGFNIGSLFGARSLSSTALSAIAGSAGGLFASGGYTGAGGANVPAGIVHKGEVVWSQADVARAGGVGMAEALRRGAVPVARGGGGGAPQAVNINVNVSGARGNQEIQQMVASGVNQGIDEFSRKGLPVRIKQVNADPRQRG